MKVDTFNKGMGNKGAAGLLFAQTAVAGVNEHRLFAELVTDVSTGTLTLDFHRTHSSMDMSRDMFSHFLHPGEIAMHSVWRLLG